MIVFYKTLAVESKKNVWMDAMRVEGSGKYVRDVIVVALACWLLWWSMQKHIYGPCIEHIVWSVDLVAPALLRNSVSENCEVMAFKLDSILLLISYSIRV